MSTIYASLPFYDSPVKQDKNRTGAIMPIHCPYNQLPPFQINCGTDTIGTVDEVLLVSCSGAETDITSFIESFIDIITVGADTYLSYNGDVYIHSTGVITTGSYYVKITGGNSIFYSDWVKISNIYPNLIKTLTNSSYDTLTATNLKLTACVSDGTGDAFGGGTQTFSVKKGETIKVITDISLDSGNSPTFAIRKAINGVAISNLVQGSDGLNEISLVVTDTYEDAVLGFYNPDGDAGEFTWTYLFVQRTYSANFMKFAFSNTNDLGDILYSTGFEQILWLEAKLNNPAHEIIEVGEEKDGIFIPEKLVTKYLYKVIAYVSRGLYQSIIRLPQHDSVTITDEVGNTYTPAAGNIIIDPIDWVTYETGKITIRFNDGSNSAFVWTKGMTNLI